MTGFDYSNALKFVRPHEVDSMKAITLSAAELLKSRKGAGNDFLGWIDLPVNYDKEEFARIKTAAKKIQSDSEILLVAETRILQRPSPRSPQDSENLLHRQQHEQYVYSGRNRLARRS